MKEIKPIYPDKAKSMIMYLGYTDMLDLLIQEFRNSHIFEDKMIIVNKFIELAKIVSSINFN